MLSLSVCRLQNNLSFSLSFFLQDFDAWRANREARTADKPRASLVFSTSLTNPTRNFHARSRYFSDRRISPEIRSRHNLVTSIVVFFGQWLVADDQLLTEELEAWVRDQRKRRRSYTQYTTKWRLNEILILPLFPLLAGRWVLSLMQVHSEKLKKETWELISWSQIAKNSLRRRAGRRQVRALVPIPCIHIFAVVWYLELTPTKKTQTEWTPDSSPVVSYKKIMRHGGW